jgi:hypothetical protein
MTLLRPIAPGCYLCGEHDELAGSPLLCRRCRPEPPAPPRKAREGWWNEPGDFPELVVPPDAPSAADEALSHLALECPRKAGAKQHEHGALRHGYWLLSGVQALTCTEERIFMSSATCPPWRPSLAQGAYDEARKVPCGLAPPSQDKGEIEVSNDGKTWAVLLEGHKWRNHRYMRRSKSRNIVFETRGLGQP